MINKVTVDCKIQRDITEKDGKLYFAISILSSKNPIKFTVIKSVYAKEDNRELVKPGNYVRIEGKLDSERLISKTGKQVYNKILVVDTISCMEKQDV